jgi:hypothetical protein
MNDRDHDEAHAWLTALRAGIEAAPVHSLMSEWDDERPSEARMNRAVGSDTATDVDATADRKEVVPA